MEHSSPSNGAVGLPAGNSGLLSGYWLGAFRDVGPPSVPSGEGGEAVSHLAPERTLTP
jgi:hypothetical protein